MRVSTKPEWEGREWCNSDRGRAEVTTASFSSRPRWFLEQRRDSHWPLTGLENVARSVRANESTVMDSARDAQQPVTLSFRQTSGPRW